MSRLRIQRLNQWCGWVSELENRDKELKSKLHPHVKQIVCGKNLALMERFMDMLNWPDKAT